MTASPNPAIFEVFPAIWQALGGGGHPVPTPDPDPGERRRALAGTLCVVAALAVRENLHTAGLRQRRRRPAAYKTIQLVLTVLDLTTQSVRDWSQGKNSGAEHMVMADKHARDLHARGFDALLSSPILFAKALKTVSAIGHLTKVPELGQAAAVDMLLAAGDVVPPPELRRELTHAWAATDLVPYLA